MPRFPRVTATLAVLAAIACGAGCSPSGGAPAPPVSPQAASASSQVAITPAPGPLPATLAQYYAQRLDWQPCARYFQCARLLVPFDYARPGWRRFSLPVVRLAAADPARRVGALVINPGGPGASGVQYALSARTGEFTPDILSRFDIVGFDPRGVGGSDPALRCMSGPQLDRFFATNDAPATAAQLAAVVSASKLYAAQCARNAAGLLPYVGTVSAAKDMDVLRAALSEPALTYLGKSYGTVLGTSYARQFPRRVRALVLDGAVDPSLTGLQVDMAQAEGFESAFGQFTAWCATQSGCPFASGSAVSQVAGLLGRANQRPLTNLVDGQPANGAMLLSGIASALYLRQEWPILKSALAEAFSAADGTVFVELANALMERNPDGTYSNLSDAELSVDCVDRPWPRSLAAWRAAGTPPVLVVGDLHDPATPYPWARALVGDLAAGVLLGWNGEGHTSYMQGSSCVDGYVDAYLVSLRAPRSGTVCA